MKFLFTLVFISITLVAQENIKDSIVKIYTVAKIPNYNIPWNSKLRQASGSGSIINGNRILTNAHVVANETFIEVKRYGATKRYEAEVEFISHQVDLAILKVKDESFFKGTKSLELGSLPKIQQKITVYGFPMGGNALSVTTGVVSRVEHTRYVHSGELFLAIQIDAAINPGSSGGPAISDDKIVGVVMQQIKKSQNIGYLVPAEIIKHFLQDIQDGKCDGFAHLGLATQKMENKALRTLYKMPNELSGVKVMDISQKSPSYKFLKDGDILLSIDGHNIENDGSVEFMPEQFTSLIYYVDKKQVGESVELEILRDAKITKADVKLSNTADDDLLVDTLEHDTMPRYFIFGGYVFTPLTRNLLIHSRSNLLKLREAAGKWATPQKDEAVILLRVLADESNRGDHKFSLWMIDELNGKKFKDFREFKKMIEESKDRFIVLKNEDGVEVAIDRDKARSVESKILRRYSIKSSASE
ncbi:PDZ domain-containing protein [Sulfurimonas sp.]